MSNRPPPPSRTKGSIATSTSALPAHSAHAAAKPPNSATPTKLGPRQNTPIPTSTLSPPVPSPAAKSASQSSTQIRDRNETAVRYSVKSLMDLVNKQDEQKGDKLAKNQKELNDLKKEIAIRSKTNFTLELEIRNLDQKIALLIRNRISLEEVMASSGDLANLTKVTVLKDKMERQRYGQLFYLLQQDTIYLARLAQLVKLGEIDNLLQTVMFTLYGNQYDEYEEHLLLSMFQTVLTDEFANSKNISGILRANTAITRMMTTYTRRDPGQQYLKSTLTGVLFQVTSAPEMSLEINPLKLYEQLINDYETNTGKVWEGERKPSQEQSAADPRVIEALKPRFDKLGELTDKTIETLINSVANVPYGIRWICKQIRELCRKHFPMATREQCCSMIGGFFLLRYVNPAIVSPQAFMLVNEKLTNYTRRNLTLLAKILQNLANNVQFGGVKEYYMEPLNKVLERNRDRVNRFLEELTKVEELEEHLNLDRYIALGKSDESVINITLNEMYSIHGFLQEHLPAITPKEADRDHTALTKLMHDLGPAPPNVSRQENASVELKLDKSIKGASEVETLQQVYQETKYLVYLVLKALKDSNNVKAESVSMNELLNIAASWARDHSNNALLESISRIRENCVVLVDGGRLSADDDYAQLRIDAVAEIVNYEDMIKKTSSDLDRLKLVLRNIQERHAWMEEQYDAYKEYLANVRQNCNRTPTSSSAKKASKVDKKTGKTAPVKPKDQKRGPFKYSHKQLEQDGIIMESEVPEDRRSSIFFAFSSNTPGIFDVTVMFKSRHIAKITLHLDDLLERQHNGHVEYETDFLKLNVNLLIFLLNRDFVS